MELKITNDNFNVEIINENSTKTINASYDIFDFKDTDAQLFIKNYISMCNEFFKGNFDKEFTLFYLSFTSKIPTITKQQIFNNTIRENKLKYNGDFMFGEKGLPNYQNEFDKLFKEYKDTSTDIITIYHCENEKDIVVSCLLHFISAGKTIVKCSRCGKYFIPTKRNDTKYCDRIDIDTNKTCKELNTYQKQLESNKDEHKKLYKAIYNTIRNKYGSNSDELNTFMVNAQIWKDKLKNNTISKKEYIDWLKSHYQYKKK